MGLSCTPESVPVPGRQSVEWITPDGSAQHFFLQDLMTLGCHKGTYKQQMSVDSIITYKFRTGLLRIHCHLGLSYVCGLVSELSVLF